MSSMPGTRHFQTPPSPWSDTASGHDTDTPSTLQSIKRKYSHTTAAQRQCLLEWLELPGNFELLTKPMGARSNDSSTLSQPKRVKKMDGYRSMAQHMNQVVHTDWSEKTARSRFESFMAAYRKAKRQSPHDLPSFFRRVDALLGPDKDVESRFRSESLGQRSEESSSRSPLVSREHDTVCRDLSSAKREVVNDDENLSPLKRKTQIKRALGTVLATSAPSSPLDELTMPEANDQALKVEAQRLAVKQQELELKQFELRTRQEENRQKLRAEVLTRLVEAGKSPAEVREYLAIMDPIDTFPR
ncbi:unnamed protein product [Peronospora belbahrii]|uniref:No apical meristem-associated C-terminal domain-containing protein n=1 Tax=Peronospora belbahrii TaxID=622444 RepID=A0ABN8D725_9STRA|nr:unnamed protein product [Peronospora belbahrii]